ncbi:response regulator [Bosea sp. Root381]|uniref:response regulator transcription factor n=1 Tax=Bosea sp. Root381 TaxID=1736524 RepID=UPI001FCE1B11|nr:response regulator [Bosea sp. Root381]
MDDDPSVLKSLSRALRIRAYETRTFASAREFLASLPRGSPACLILDVQMPGMTGLELHHQMVEAGFHIPTIVITAHSDVKVRETSETTDVVAVLSKPLRNATLFDAVAIALGSTKARGGGQS